MILIEEYTRRPIRPAEAILLRELITFPGLVTYERLIYALWGFSSNGWDAPTGAHGALLTHICRLRRSLRWRVRIDAKWNVGYSLRLVPESVGCLDVAA